MSNDDELELEKFENLMLNWSRTATIFLLSGIALYHFTSLGKQYSIIAFLLTIILIGTMVIDYVARRNELTSKGIDIRISLDIIVAVMIIAIALILSIIWEIIVES